MFHLLWGTSLEDCWNHGIERNSQGILALTCSHALRWKDWRPSGRVPLIPCFLDRNATSTIPHKYSSRQWYAFECCCADGHCAGPTSRRGSHVYEINTWLWTFELPQPASLWPRLRRSEGSPGLRLPSADGQLSRQASDLHMVNVWYIHGIYLVYPWYILSYSKSEYYRKMPKLLPNSA